MDTATAGSMADTSASTKMKFILGILAGIVFALPAIAEPGLDYEEHDDANYIELCWYDGVEAIPVYSYPDNWLDANIKLVRIGIAVNVTYAERFYVDGEWSTWYFVLTEDGDYGWVQYRNIC